MSVEYDDDDSMYDILNGVGVVGGGGRGGYSYDSSSSPSDDSNSSSAGSNSAADNAAWAYELGLSSVPSRLVALPPSPATWSAQSPLGLGPGQELGHDTRLWTRTAPDDTMAMTNEFWSTNGTTAASDHPSQSRLAGATAVKSETGMDLDFEDVLSLNDSQSRPLSINSPDSNDQPSPRSAATTTTLNGFSTNGNAFMPQQQQQQQQQHSQHNGHGLSLPVDLLAVNQGIAPQLTSGIPTPPLDTSNQLETRGGPLIEPHQFEQNLGLDPRPQLLRAKSARKEQQQLQQQRSRRNSNDADVSRSNSRETSVSRRSSTTNGHGVAASTAPATTSSGRAKKQSTAASIVSTTASGAATPSLLSQAHLVGASTNLVTKDAVVAAHSIPSISSASSPTTRVQLAQSGLELLVLGIPIAGAKSRVETQIKISLVLVRTRKGVVADPAISSASDLPGQRFITLDGGLEQSAGNHYERVGAWTHLRLPSILALKKKGKKQAKPDPSPEDTLTLNVSVNRGTEPHEEIHICAGCQAREHKRAQRKKDSQAAVTRVAEAQLPLSEQEERRKVVVFNTGEFVEFGQGEVVLPTRITCYCRHHKERKGFAVSFTLTDHRGVVVANGITPPIMITDDHKTKDTTKLNPAQLSAALAAHQQPADNGNAADTTLNAKAKKPKTSTTQLKKAAAAGTSGSATPSHGNGARTKRANGGRSKAGRGSPDSEDEQALSLPGSGTSTPATGGGGARVLSAGRKAKPYDAESRPAKKRVSVAGSHRSPAFAMTPLAGPSPPLRAVDVTGTNSAAPSQAPSPATASSFHSAAPSLAGLSPPGAMPNEQWESALGLGGMNDTVMTDSLVQRGSISTTEYSSAPSPQAFEWRSSNSSPAPLSPRSNATSANASDFQSFFNALQSPAPLGTTVQPLASPPIEAIYPNQTQAFNSAFGSASPAVSPVDWVVAQQQVHQQQQQQQARQVAPLPRISRLIPGEGPVHGGIEVTVLGENFVPDLTCVFGDSPAVPTHYWSSNTLVCVLPPSANPGPVVVGIKGVPLTVEQANGLQLFTYKDDSDRSLLELALQVVGLKMTGRLEDASAVAMRIVGNSNQASGSNGSGGAGMPNAGSIEGAGRTASLGSLDTATLAQQLNMAASTVFTARQSGSRTPSRRSSLALDDSTLPPPMPYTATPGEARNFEGIVIKFLSLLDLDPSLIPGAAPSLPSARPPISHLNRQQHNLLHLACVLGFHRLVQFLLARNIDLDSRDRNGFTPLHFAALYGRVAITRQLLDAGANSMARNRAGKTPLEIARDRDDVDVEEILLRAPRHAHPSASAPLPRVQPSTSHQQHMLERHFRIVSQAAQAQAQPYQQQQQHRSSARHSRRTSAYATPAATDSEASVSDEFGFEFDSESALSDSFDAGTSDESVESESEADSDDDEQVLISDDDDSNPSEDDDGDDVDGSGLEDELDGGFAVDLERRLSRSRNASMVSLHYLLEAEQDAREQAPWTPDVKVAPVVEKSSSVNSAKKNGNEKEGVARAPPSAWFFSRGNGADKELKLGARPPSFHDKLQPLSDGMNDMWEKAKANRFTIPLQMPELTAFHAMAHSMPSAFSWRGGKSDAHTDDQHEEGEGQGGGPGTDSDATIVPSTQTSDRPGMRRDAADKQSQRDWRQLYSAGSWFHKGPSSPPPVYSPTDRLHSAPQRSPVETVSPVASTTALPAVQAPAPARSRRHQRVAGSQQYATSDRALQSLRQDKMLCFFWIPVLLFGISFALYANGHHIRPLADAALDAVWPHTVADILN